MQFFLPLQVGSTSSQSRASRNARQCLPVWPRDPDLQPQTRRAESLRCTPLPAYVGSRRSGQSLPPPARLSRINGRMLVLELDCQCKLPYTILPRISRIKTGACRGLRPCPLCHLCPATATAIAVAASGPKQHRTADERPLQPRCEVQCHHPPEGNCRIYIFIYSLGIVDDGFWKVNSNG